MNLISRSPRATKRMQATARMASVVSWTLPARRRLIRDVSPLCTRLMNLSSPIELSRRSVWSWLCSASPAIAASALALLAVHGWVLGDSAAISENTGPGLFEVHLLLMGVLMLFATWLAAPAWLALCISRTFRQPMPTLVLQVIVFVIGWLLVFAL